MLIHQLTPAHVCTSTAEVMMSVARHRLQRRRVGERRRQQQRRRRGRGPPRLNQPSHQRDERLQHAERHPADGAAPGGPRRSPHHQDVPLGAALLRVYPRQQGSPPQTHTPTTHTRRQERPTTIPAYPLLLMPVSSIYIDIYTYDCLFGRADRLHTTSRCLRAPQLIEHMYQCRVLALLCLRWLSRRSARDSLPTGSQPCNTFCAALCSEPAPSELRITS